MARVVIAEAGDQGASGVAGVVFTILNRLSDGRWGGTVEAVVDAPGQFEPVARAGGSWRSLRPVSAAQEAKVSTIVNLALDGRLPDLTGGARYFQNPQIVAARARAGTVPASLVDFGGVTPSAVIGAHAFYPEFYSEQVRAHRSATGESRARALAGSRGSASVIFVGENRADLVAESRLTEASHRPPTRPADDGDAIFVQ